MFNRILKLDLPKQQSIFLWGARQTGKSSFLKKNFKNSIYYDLLDTKQVMEFTRYPNLLREQLLSKSAKELAYPVIIDEIQKVPNLLNEVHWLIENKQIQFILCGSSARKLKTQATNLLGGRAWPYYFHPLTSQEIPNIDLLLALQHGLLPNHYLSEPKYINDRLQAYIDIYLTDEIRNEGLVRNLMGFARFLDLSGLCNAQMINLSNIARDCHVDRATIKGYFQILIDTLLGFFVQPYTKKIKRDIIASTPKFYLFDIGVANYLAKQSVSSLQGSTAGNSFEHFIFMELTAYKNYSRKRFEINYWRTKSGLEVDFILDDGDIAIEVKISRLVHKQDLKGLIAFCEEHSPKTALVVSQDSEARILEITDKIKIHILPWREFLSMLWSRKVV
jgi:uncharacterized protein